MKATMFALGLTAVLSVPHLGYADSVSEREPNNSVLGAQELPLIADPERHTIAGSVGGSDSRDFYRVEVTDYHQLELTLSRTASLNKEMFVALYYDTDDDEQIDDSEIVRSMVLHANVSRRSMTFKGMHDGVYYLMVDKGSSSTPYTLEYYANTDRAGHVGFEPKDNDPKTPSVLEGFLSGYRLVRDTVHGGPGGPADVQDWFRFSTFTARNVALYLMPRESNASLLLYQDTNKDGVPEFIAGANANAGSYGYVAKYLPAGDYLVMVYKAPGSGFTSYDLLLGGN